MLTRVDGKASPSDIAQATGLELQQVESHLNRLVKLGAVRVAGFDSSRSSMRPAQSQRPPSGSMPAASPRISQAPRAPVPLKLYPATELDEDVEIIPEMRVHILNLFYSLRHLNHYEVLGVRADAQRTEIKTHYFDAVSKFHPDRYFGKELGSFKDKLATVFQRLTEAHEALSRKRNRAEYDGYLKGRSATQAPPKGLNTQAAAAEVAFLYEGMAKAEAAKSEPSPPSGEGISQTVPPMPPPISESGFAIPPQGRLPNIGGEPTSQSAAPTSPTASSRPQPAKPRRSRAPGSRSSPTSSMPPERSSTRTSSPPGARRHALARKLRASMSPGRPTTMPPAPKSSIPPGNRTRPPGNSTAPPSAPANRQSLRATAARSLRAQFDARLSERPTDGSKKFIDIADEAIKNNDYVSAVNALKIAVSMKPEDTALAGRLNEAETKASASMFEQYLEQARYEEKNGSPLEAAKNYERACKGKPSAQLFERAAACYFDAKAELKLAGKLAKSSIDLDESRTSARVLLARIYAHAGMAKSALSELERAATLAPEDDTIREWIKRVKRGDA